MATCGAGAAWSRNEDALPACTCAHTERECHENGRRFARVASEASRRYLDAENGADASCAKIDALAAISRETPGQPLKSGGCPSPYRSSARNRFWCVSLFYLGATPPRMGTPPCDISGKGGLGKFFYPPLPRSEGGRGMRKFFEPKRGTGAREGVRKKIRFYEILLLTQ